MFGSSSGWLVRDMRSPDSGRILYSLWGNRNNPRARGSGMEVETLFGFIARVSSVAHLPIGPLAIALKVRAASELVS